MNILIRALGAAVVALCLATPPAHASVVIGGTRVVFPAQQGEVTVRLSNKSDHPALVEAWIDTGNPNSTPDSVSTPFLITPPLFRMEQDRPAVDGQKSTPVSEFELASRLSYFLWSTMPDAALLALADKGELRKPGVLEAQVRRMLKDPKSKALSENFAGQWLQLRSLRTLEPDKGYFPAWDDKLRAAMIGEAEAFFQNIVREDRFAQHTLADHPGCAEDHNVHRAILRGVGCRAPEKSRLFSGDARGSGESGPRRASL